MSYSYHVCDVFTNTAFGGNQLAVLPDARGLNDRQLQQIAREFNYSESAFVFPPEEGQTRKVRIFTPLREVPFAGHPNVGTAFVLAATGELGELPEKTSITFEEKAGLIHIDIVKQRDGRLYCEIKAPQDFSTGITIPADVLAQALGLNEEDIVTSHHPPMQASVGLPFIIAELINRDALTRASANTTRLQALGVIYDVWPSIHLYVHSRDEFDIRARMFAPLAGVPEDPATGSANCALSALLAHLDEQVSGEYRYTIAQGVEMGRPSVLRSRVEKQDGKIVSTKIGGEAVITCTGALHVPNPM